MRLIALACLLGTAAFACGTPEVTPFDPQGDDTAAEHGSTSASATTTKAPSNTAAVVTPSTPTTPTPATTEAPKPDTTWTGTLTATSAVAYGGTFEGTTYCNYKMHFANVIVHLTLTADGAVRSADVTGNMIEAAVGTCPNALIPENVHDYAFTPDTPTVETTFQATAGEQNQPKASLSADVTTAAPGHVTLTWHRTDIGAPFNWSLTADLPLTQD